MVDTTAFEEAGRRVEAADLFVAVGTSGVVWPAAGFIELAIPRVFCESFRFH